MRRAPGSPRGGGGRQAAEIDGTDIVLWRRLAESALADGRCVVWARGRLMRVFANAYLCCPRLPLARHALLTGLACQPDNLACAAMLEAIAPEEGASVPDGGRQNKRPRLWTVGDDRARAGMAPAAAGAAAEAPVELTLRRNSGWKDVVGWVARELQRKPRAVALVSGGAMAATAQEAGEEVGGPVAAEGAAAAAAAGVAATQSPAGDVTVTAAGSPAAAPLAEGGVPDKAVETPRAGAGAVQLQPRQSKRVRDRGSDVGVKPTARGYRGNARYAPPTFDEARGALLHSRVQNNLTAVRGAPGRLVPEDHPRCGVSVVRCRCAGTTSGACGD